MAKYIDVYDAEFGDVLIINGVECPPLAELIANGEVISVRFSGREEWQEFDLLARAEVKESA